jgi:dienelactone hydrolase
MTPGWRRKRRWPLDEAVRVAGAAFEAHAYPGSAQLFTDPDLPEYDRASSDEMWERVLAFLARIDASVPVVEVHPVSESRIVESTPFKDFRD